MENCLRRMKLDSSYAIGRYLTDVSVLAVRNVAPKVVAASAPRGPLASYVLFIWDRVDARKDIAFDAIVDRLHDICRREGRK